MLSPPLAMVMLITPGTPVATAAETGSSEPRARRAAHSLRRPRKSGSRPRSQIQPLGTRVRPSAARNEMTTRAAIPAYWPAQICQARGRPPAREAALSTARTTMSSTLVAANRPAAIATVTRLGSMGGRSLSSSPPGGRRAVPPRSDGCARAGSRPQVVGRHLGSLHQGLELHPGHARQHGVHPDERGEAAVGAGDDALPAYHVGEAYDPLRHQPWVLDVVGLHVDHADDQSLVVGQLHLLPDLPLVLVPRIGRLDVDVLRRRPEDEVGDLAQLHVPVVRRGGVAPADVIAHLLGGR